MAKLKRGARGERGIPGPPGPAGAMGLAGVDGDRGLMGKPGAIGAAGRTGARGAKGSAGVTPPSGGQGRKRVIAALDRHIENIYGELTAQMKRIARIQSQVDELRDKIRKAL